MQNYQILLAIAGSITALTVILKAVINIGKLWKTVVHFLDDYFGEEERPGFEGRPGLQERLRLMEENMEAIAYEMKPNSGSSIKDAINRIESRLTELEKKSD